MMRSDSGQGYLDVLRKINEVTVMIKDIQLMQKTEKLNYTSNVDDR